ncbi:Cellulose synthase [Sesbania bispinosa]|nr:Cellulose synthase [Sesbania bispinosa]
MTQKPEEATCHHGYLFLLQKSFSPSFGSLTKLFVGVLFQSVFRESLPVAIDVFICTADPIKEHILDVMNTVLSTMALVYPQQKLNVYIPDEGIPP